MTSAGSEFREREGRRRRVWTVVVVLAIVVIGVALGKDRLGFGGDQAPAEQAAGPPGGGMPPMPVDVDSARQQSVTDAVRATGRIEAINSVDLRPDEQGRILELLFREGQVVASGEPLVRIDDAMLKAQAERAKADRDLAQQQLERVRRLRAENASSAADLERAEAAARSTVASLALLELQIARTTVKAPFAGIVGQRWVSAGDYVTTADRLLTLRTVDPQHAVIEVPERHAAQLKRGQTVEFTVASEPGRVFRAQVDFIDPAVQNESRTIIVKARAPNPGHRLKPGMFIEARLATAKRPNAIVIPEDAVQPLRTANIVWVVQDGKASRRVVQLGARSQGIVEILEGIKAGDVVVVGGLERMQEGMPVAPRPRASGTSPSPGG